MRKLGLHSPIVTSHRYRRAEEEDAPIVPIAEALAELSSLRILRIHLESRLEGDAAPGREDIHNFVVAASKAMGTFAETLAPSALKWLCFLIREEFSTKWRTHRVVGDGMAPARAEQESTAWDIIGGCYMREETGPSPCPVVFSRFKRTHEPLPADYSLSAARD
ncbi:hypothetical protein C8Q80DRAFT_1265355 [Daedaleopsis nitida]|nr:hypothetical protein C8Q80DRAFT_1265355 [Daedaleopsis nitida]